MPAANNKNELLDLTDKEFVKLSNLLDTVDREVAVRPFEEGWSIKDIVAHRAHWIHLFLGWYSDGQAGKDIAFPAPGYKWNRLKAYNLTVREKQSGLSWEEARVEFLSAHDEFSRFLSEQKNEDLFGVPMKGARNGWTTGRWAEAAGPTQYRSAAKFIRACLRAA